MKNKFFLINILVISLLSIISIHSKTAFPQTDSKLQFEISFPKEAHSEPITGRVYVMISENDRREPRLQIGTRGEPFFGKDIKGLKPGQSILIDEQMFGYPLESIAEIPPGDYFVQGFVNIYTEFKRSDGHKIWLHND